MATPANRVPVRIARGTKANLDTAMAAGDLKAGEICYATDENAVYVVEGGVLTQAGADLSTESIDALQDVDTTTAAPTDGQALVWVDANGAWEPRDVSVGSLDDLGNVASGATDQQILRYNAAASEWRPTNLQESPSRIQDQTDFRLNEDTSTITIYTFDADGTAPAADVGKINSYKDSGFLYISTTTNTGVDMPIPWPSLTFYWRYAGDPTWTQTSADTASSRTESGRTFFDLQRSGGEPTWPDNVAQEVELAFQDPANPTFFPIADGDHLEWDDTYQAFRPAQLATVATSGSYNDLTDQPTIISRIQDADDFELNVALALTRTYSNNTLASIASTNGDGAFSRGFHGLVGSPTQANTFIFYETDDNGNLLEDIFTAGGYTNGDPVYISADAGSTWTAYATTAAGEVTGYSTHWGIKSDTLYNDLTSFTSIVVSVVNPEAVSYEPLTDEDILQYDSASGKFKPSQIVAAPVDSVNGETGVVSLGIQEMDDFVLNVGDPPPSDFSYTITTTGSTWPAGTMRFNPDSGGRFYLNFATTNGDNSGNNIASVVGIGDTMALRIGGNEPVQVTVDDIITVTDAILYRVAQPEPDLSALANGVAVDVYTSGTGERPEIPLAEGEVLAWNATDNKFKPTPLPASIDDLSDVVTAGGYTGNTTWTSDSSPDNPGGWSFSTVSNYLSYNNAQAGAGKMGDLEVGDVVTLTWSDDSTSTLTIQEAEVYNNPESHLIRFTSNLTDGVQSGGVTISVEGRFGPAVGQILGFDGTEWSPVDPVTRIQDMDDYALNKDISTFNVYTLSGVGATTSMTNGTFHYNGYWLYFTQVDANGESIPQPSTAAPLYWREQGTTTWNAVSLNTSVDVNVGSGNTIDGWGMNNGGAGGFPTNGLTIELALQSFDDLPEIPLADGDGLAWDAADSKFKPTPIATSLDGLSDVSTSGGYAGNTEWTSDTTPSGAGRWSFLPTANWISYDNAQSGAGKMGDLQVGDDVTITWSDGSTSDFVVQAAEAYNDPTSHLVRFTTNVTDGVAAGGILVTVARLHAATAGQVLTYNGTEWAPADGSGVDGLPTTGGTMTGDLLFDGGSGTTIEMLADGRVNIGPSGGIYGFATYDRISISDPQGPRIAFGRNDTEVVDGDLIGALTFNGTDDDGFYEECASILAEASAPHSSTSKPTLIKFYTTNTNGVAPVAHAQLRGDGRFDIYTEANGINARTFSTAGTSNHFFAGWSSATSLVTGTLQFKVFNNGDVVNANNSYGAISDITLKENVAPASVQWDNIKAIEIVNYNFKEETGHQTHKQLGVIAQQVEEVSPGLVSTGEDGLKSVNYSVLYMKAVKALQEAMERIEVLEQRLNDAGID